MIESPSPSASIAVIYLIKSFGLICWIEVGSCCPDLQHELWLEIAPDLSQFDLRVALASDWIEDQVTAPTSLHPLEEGGRSGWVEGNGKVTEQGRTNQWFG